MNEQSLFEPWLLRSGCLARNRLVMAPMTTWSSHDDGQISTSELAYLKRRSQGVGIVITAACYVQRSGKAFSGQWGCDADDKLASLHAAADVIHSQGALAVLQLHHGGRMCPVSLLGHTPFSSSAIPAERPGADIPQAMTQAHIEDTFLAFENATRRAIAAGYDGVEIHGANTYLLQQFFSPHSNRRDDKWGGTLEQRMLFPLRITDIVRSVASEASRPFLVGYRISPEETETPGISIEETLQLTLELVKRHIDWLHVSTRNYRTSSLREPGAQWRPTRKIIDIVSGAVDVIGVGAVHTPDDALFIREDGCAAVALGRILLMEPDWVERILTGNLSEIRGYLPSVNGSTTLTIPEPLYNTLLSRDGWLPVRHGSGL